MSVQGLSVLKVRHWRDRTIKSSKKTRCSAVSEISFAVTRGAFSSSCACFSVSSCLLKVSASTRRQHRVELVSSGLPEQFWASKATTREPYSGLTGSNDIKLKAKSATFQSPYAHLGSAISSSTDSEDEDSTEIQNEQLLSAPNRAFSGTRKFMRRNLHYHDESDDEEE